MWPKHIIITWHLTLILRNSRAFAVRPGGDMGPGAYTIIIMPSELYQHTSCLTGMYRCTIQCGHVTATQNYHSTAYSQSLGTLTVLPISGQTNSKYHGNKVWHNVMASLYILQIHFLWANDFSCLFIFLFICSTPIHLQYTDTTVLALLITLPMRSW